MGGTRGCLSIFMIFAGSILAVKEACRPSHGGTRREEEDCKAGGGRGGLVAGRVMVRRDAEGQWPAGVGRGRERGCRRTRPHGLAAGTRARSSSN